MASTAPQELSRLALQLLQECGGRAYDRSAARRIAEAFKAYLGSDGVVAATREVLALKDTQIRDIMIPRSHMVVIERDGTTDEILESIVALVPPPPGSPATCASNDRPSHAPGVVMSSRSHSVADRSTLYSSASHAWSCTTTPGQRTKSGTRMPPS